MKAINVEMVLLGFIVVITGITGGIMLEKRRIGQFIVSVLVSGSVLSILALIILEHAINSVTVGRYNGSYYEVLVTTPAVGGGTLIQARDITDKGKIKTSVLLEYPPKGYTTDTEGGKTFLIPTYVRVTAKAGEYIFATTDGKAHIYSSPPVSEKEK